MGFLMADDGYDMIGASALRRLGALVGPLRSTVSGETRETVDWLVFTNRRT